jgi:hypothetical protein
MTQAINEAGEDPMDFYNYHSLDLLMLAFPSEIQKEYTKLTNNLYTQISTLNNEIQVLKLAARELPSIADSGSQA